MHNFNRLKNGGGGGGRYKNNNIDSRVHEKKHFTEEISQKRQLTNG